MLSAMDENTTNRILDLEKKVDCLEEEYRRRREEYERNWRFAVQLSYTLDKQLGDKLLEKSGCVNADKLLIFPCISAIQKAILKKRHYKDILDEQQRKVVIYAEMQDYQTNAICTAPQRHQHISGKNTCVSKKIIKINA